MFRRSEDKFPSNESDTDTPSSQQGSLLGASFNDSAAVVSPDRTATSASTAASATATTATPASGAAFQMSASTPARPAMGSTTGTFRGATPAADAARARMPETGKPLPVSLNPNAQPAQKDSRRILTVGADILLKGEIATCDRLVIEGKVDAVLNDVGTVELAESGSFKGIAQVENAEISGLFEGELIVKGRLVIYASGKVRGKITYGEIEIERGGEISGEIKNFSSAQSGGRSSRAGKDDKVAA